MTMTVRNDNSKRKSGTALSSIAVFMFPLALATISVTTTTVQCFQPPLPLRTTTAARTSKPTEHRSRSNNNHDDPVDEETCGNDRRRFLAKASAAAAASLPLLALAPPQASGIDVSGLRTEGGPPSNGVVAAQLQGLASTDSGTAASRARELKQGTTSAAEQRSAAAVTAGQRPVLSKEVLGSAGVYARVSGGGSLQTLGVTKLNNRYTGFVEGPAPNDRPLPIQFDFPTDWLRLDRANGGLQYVDQRNGSKLYVLRAPLPPGTDLATVPKSFFDDSVFDLNGDVVRFGTVVGAHRTARSAVTQDDARAAYLQRRLQLNYETLAGNGVQTIERRGLLDAYEIGGYAYMMLATCNSVKFEKKDSPERATTELIVDSFRVGQ